MIEVESDILSDVIKCKGYHKREPKFGDRAWRVKGKKADIIYWDTGNCWCAIMQVIPKEKRDYKKIAAKFYEELHQEIAKRYDENMYRID